MEKEYPMECRLRGDLVVNLPDEGEPEEEEIEPTWLDTIRWWVGYALLAIGNLLFVRPAERLMWNELTTTGELHRALNRNEIINRYGIEGAAMLKSFNDYLQSADEDPDDEEPECCTCNTEEIDAETA